MSSLTHLCSVLIKEKEGFAMALCKIPAMLRMSLRYVNTLQVFNGFLCPLLALLTDWDVPPIRNTRRIIALLMFLNGFALERKYLTRSQNCSRAHTTGTYGLMDSPSINVREKKQINIWYPSSTKAQLQLMVAQICQL